MRYFRSLLFGLTAAAAVAWLGLAPSARSAVPTAGRMKAVEKVARDLAPAPPESVGMSSERLRRIDPAMKRHWLRILPLLSPRDVERLRETLQAAGHDSTTPLVRDGAHP